MFAFHFSKFDFNPNFIQFLEILIPTCVKDVKKKLESNDEDGTSFTFETHLGESFDIDNLCATVFWMFKPFAERFIIIPPPGSKNKLNSKPKPKPSVSSNANANSAPNNNESGNTNINSTPSGNFSLTDSFVPSLPELFLSIKSQLSSISPSTNSLLETRGIKTLDFCVSDFNHFFVSQRPLNEAQLFITAMLASTNIPQFLAAVLCSLLVLLQSNLQRVPPFEDLKNSNSASSNSAADGSDKESSKNAINARVEMFKRIFTTSLPVLDMRLILYNEEGLCGSRSRAISQQQKQANTAEPANA